MKNHQVISSVLAIIVICLVSIPLANAQLFPYSDHLQLTPDDNSLDSGIPYFTNSINDPIEVDFSGSYVHTNSDGSFYVKITTSTDYVRGPYDENDQVVYPWPNLIEDSVQNSGFKIWWASGFAGDASAFFDLVIDDTL